MSEGKPVEEPSCIMREYGLDAMLTHEDDPNLWRALVWRFFPAPSNLRRMEPEQIPSLTFEVAIWSERMLRQIEVEMTQLRKGGCWRITRLPSGDLLPIECHGGQPPYPHISLRVHVPRWDWL